MAITEPDLKTTLREFQEYLDLSYESPREFAARIGVAKETIWYWLSGGNKPRASSLAKLRRFLDNEAKRPAQGDGIRPIETIPYKIIRPLQQVRYARLCPFCRKGRGKIRKPARRYFVSGTCPKCGATGPKREGHQGALRAWNGSPCLPSHGNSSDSCHSPEPSEPQHYFGLGVGVASCWFKAPALAFGVALGVVCPWGIISDVMSVAPKVSLTGLLLRNFVRAQKVLGRPVIWISDIPEAASS